MVRTYQQYYMHGSSRTRADPWGGAGMGDGTSSVDNLEIVDRVLIPTGIPDGEYVLNWRYDCEESNQ